MIYSCTFIYYALIVTGVPAIVPDIKFNQSTININETNVSLTLNWGEPFHNLDPILSYTVSCSGDANCPPDFTTTDATIRRYTIKNLTPKTKYTFSVVATNSIGSGKAYIQSYTTVGEIIIMYRCICMHRYSQNIVICHK